MSTVSLDSLVTGPNNVIVSVDAVADPDLRSGLQGLISVQSVEETHVVIASKKLDRIVELAGTLRLLKNVHDVNDVAIDTAHWYDLGRTRPPGLDCLGLLDAVVLNPESFHSAMCFCPQTLSADTLHDFFTVCRSEEGSNRWGSENRIIGFWRDLLLDIEEAETEILSEKKIFLIFSSSFQGWRLSLVIGQVWSLRFCIILKPMVSCLSSRRLIFVLTFCIFPLLTLIIW